MLKDFCLQYLTQSWKTVFIAVSYTHLDVYKRQVYSQQIKLQFFCSITMPPPPPKLDTQLCSRCEPYTTRTITIGNFGDSSMHGAMFFVSKTTQFTVSPYGSFSHSTELATKSNMTVHLCQVKIMMFCLSCMK